MVFSTLLSCAENNPLAEARFRFLVCFTPIPRRCRTEEVSMADFIATMVDEAFERQVRKSIESALRKSAERGEEGGQAAKSVLSFLFNQKSEIMRRAAPIVGFTLPLLGSAVAGVIKKPGFFDSILPNDSRPGVKQAKMVLQTIAPAFAIGASEAVGDAIKRVVDSKVSDKVTTPEAQQTKPLDRPVISRMIPGRVFICEAHEDGRTKMGADQLPVISDREWRNAVRLWEAAYNAAGGHSGRNNGRDESSRFPYEHVSFETAADLMFGEGGTNVDADKLLELKKGPDKPKAGYAAFTDATVNVLEALAGTVSGMSDFDYDQAEDLIKDQFKEIDPAKVNLLGRFQSAIQPGEVTHFTPAKYKQILTFIDTMLGGERNWFNTARRHFRSFLDRHGSTGDSFFERAKWLFKWIWSYARWVLLAGSFPFIFFVICFCTAAYGTFMLDSGGDKELLISVRCLVFGTWGMLISLTFLKVVDVVFRPIGTWVGMAPDAFTDIGRKVSAFVGVYGFLMVLVKLWASGLGMFLLPHYLLLASAAGSYGFMMMALSAGWIGQTKLWVLEGATAIKKLVVGALIASLAGSFLLGLIKSGLGTTWFEKTWNAMWANFYENRLFASIVILAIYVVVVIAFARLTERFRSFTNNGTTYVKEFSGMAQFAGFLIGLALILLPWYPSKKWVEDEEVQATTSMTSQSAGNTTHSVAPSASVPRRQVQNAPAVQQSPRDTRIEPPCSEIDPALRRYVARCQGR